MIYIFSVMALVLMRMAFYFKKQSLAFGAIGGWLLLGVQAYILSTAVWDIYFALFFVSMGFVIVSAIEAMALRERHEEEPPPDLDSMDEYNKGMDEYEEEMERHRTVIMGSRERRLRRHKERERRSSKIV